MKIFWHAKIMIVDVTGLDRDALHIYVGFTVYIVCCLLTGWKARDWKPWLVVLAAGIAGEALDLWISVAYDKPVMIREGLKDVLNTVLVPTVILLAARFSAIFRQN